MMQTPGTQGAPARSKVAQRENFVGRTLRDGEYIIETVLGQGGMGRVFLASHTTLQVPVAIKQGIADQPIPEPVIAELDRLLRSETLIHRTSRKLTEQDFPLSGGVHTDRFLREALLLARLQHASLPTLYDYFVEDGFWYLVMDYIPGPTLSSYIQKHAPLPSLEALNYAMQLCDVLEYLHKQSPPVIFRDLKPSNIILSPDGRVMLVDFGIARYFKSGQSNDTTEFGSPGYAPPEQYKGEGQTDGRSDLYSLGVILHEMLSGKRPVGMSDKLETLHSINPAISVVLSGLVTVATRSEPMYRFQSTHTFYLALERAYCIDERRTYQQSILTLQEGELTSLQTLASPLEGKKPAAFHLDTHVMQRQQTRDALYEVRRERQEQEHAEQHLASIDESLRHRSSMGFTPLPLTAELDDEQEEEELPPPRSLHTMRRILQTIVGLVLLLLIILATVNLTGFLVQHTPPIAKHQLRSTPTPSLATPLSTPTAPASSTWQALPSLPSPEADNAGIYVQVQGRAYIYLSGGFRGSTVTPRYDHNLYRYDISAAHWELAANNNFPGMVNDVVALDEHNNLFFTAGYSSDVFAITSLLYMYQPTTGKIQKILPPPQEPLGFGASLFADQHKHLYITQGFMQAGNPHTLAGTGWYRYDIDSGQWHVLAPLPTGLGYAILASDGAGGILMLGGAMDAGQDLPTRQIYRYDIAQNTWALEQISAPAILSGASSCMSTAYQLVIVGGYNAVNNRPLGQAWLVNLPDLHWKALPPLPTGGSVLGTASCDGAGHLYLTRGANDPSHPTSDFWQLTLP